MNLSLIERMFEFSLPYWHNALDRALMEPFKSDLNWFVLKLRCDKI